MKSRLFLLGGFLLLLAVAASASITVTADDGAALRVDKAKLVKLTESAMQRAGVRAMNVSIAVGAPEVFVSTAGIRLGGVILASQLPPNEAGTIRFPSHVYEIVRVTYTITDATGAVLETERLALEIGHDATLAERFTTMHTLASFIATRAASLRR